MRFFIFLWWKFEWFLFDSLPYSVLSPAFRAKRLLAQISHIKRDSERLRKKILLESPQEKESLAQVDTVVNDCRLGIAIAIDKLHFYE